MKMLTRTLLPAVLCMAVVPSTGHAKWCLFSKLKCRSSCNVAATCPTPCAEQVIASCQPVACDSGCGTMMTESIVAEACAGEMIIESFPSETVYHENHFNEGIVVSETPIAMEPAAPIAIESDSVIAAPVADPTPIQPVADVATSASVATEQAVTEAENAAKEAKAELAAVRKESVAALAAAKAASQEQIEKLKTQNANLKKNLDAARKRLERLQPPADQNAKRDDEPKAKAARDSQGDEKKPGERKPANKKKPEENAENKKPAAAEGKKAAPKKAKTESE